jgi:hypothetical protein
MIYLTGATNDRDERKLLEYGVGLMLNPGSGYNADRVSRYGSWAADNGCFSQGDRFNQHKWLAWLERFTSHAATCLFVVAPDVVGDPAATWARSREVLPVIRAMGFLAAFVGQDGQEHLPIPWDAFDCLSSPAYALVREAKLRGKWCHLGRCNSWRRFRAAMLSGYDSCDGTYIAYNPIELTERVGYWMRQQVAQPALTLWEDGDQWQHTHDQSKTASGILSSEEMTMSAGTGEGCASAGRMVR